MQAMPPAIPELTGMKQHEMAYNEAVCVNLPLSVVNHRKVW